MALAEIGMGKNARKLLNQANTTKRSEYLEILKGLMQDALDNDHLLVFIDEAHIQHRLNQTPLDIADRLWVKSHLEPTEEKLRVSS